MKKTDFLKKQMMTLLSLLLTGAVFFSEASENGLLQGGRAVWPLLIMSLAVGLLNCIPDKKIIYACADQPGGQTPGSASGRRGLRLAVGIFLAVAAVPVVLVITQIMIRPGWQLQPAYLWYNLVLFSLFLILIFLLLGNMVWTAAVFSVLLVLPALVCHYVTRFRGKPLTVFDVLGIRTAADVASGYVIRLSFVPGICLMALLVFLTLQIRFQTIRLPGTLRAGMIRTLAALLTMFAIYGFCRRFLWTETWMQAGDDYVLQTTYARKGFYPKFLSGLGYLHIEKPEQYSLKEVDRMIDRLQDTEPDVMDPEASLAVPPVNLIVIMNESFADLSMFGEIRTEPEILPYYHSLVSGDGIHVQKGILHVPVFGGGTANTEYEVLTGNSMQFLTGNVVAYEAYCHDPEYGLATTLKDQGYRTLAIHPGWDNAWNRKQVFPEMGFDEAIFKKNWGSDYETLRGKVTDQEAYRKIEQVYAEKEPGEKLFTFCVTIQNHGGYSSETAEGYEPDVRLEYEQDYPETALYFSLLRESDRALKELLDHFAEVPEPTMVVFFGDHQVAPDLDAFYAQVLEAGVRASSESEAEAAEKRYAMPLLIWTNYEPGQKTLQLMQEETEISANYLGSYILELTGLKMTPYNRLLLKLKDTLPVLGLGVNRTADGRWIEADGGTDEETGADWQQLLAGYRILQYNNVLDWRNRKTRGFVIGS